MAWRNPPCARVPALPPARNSRPRQRKLLPGTGSRRRPPNQPFTTCRRSLGRTPALGGGFRGFPLFPPGREAFPQPVKRHNPLGRCSHPAKPGTRATGAPCQQKARERGQDEQQGRKLSRRPGCITHPRCSGTQALDFGLEREPIQAAFQQECLFLQMQSV